MAQIIYLDRPSEGKSCLILPLITEIISKNRTEVLETTALIIITNLENQVHTVKQKPDLVIPFLPYGDIDIFDLKPLILEHSELTYSTNILNRYPNRCKQSKKHTNIIRRNPANRGK